MLPGSALKISVEWGVSHQNRIGLKLGCGNKYEEDDTRSKCTQPNSA